MIKEIINLDKQLFIFLNNLGSETWDSFWLLISNKIAMFCIIICFILFYARRIKIKQWIYFILFFILCVGVTDFLHVQLFKNIFMRLRPCWESDMLHQIRPLLVDCGGHYGFISGHAANATAMVVFLIYSLNIVNNMNKFILFGWVFLVAYSRIYLAKHYPLDVICGAFFGAFIAIIIFKSHQYILKK